MDWKSSLRHKFLLFPTCFVRFIKNEHIQSKLMINPIHHIHKLITRIINFSIQQLIAKTTFDCLTVYFVSINTVGV